MGKALSQKVCESSEFEIIAGVDKNLPRGSYFPVYNDFTSCPKVDCVIDFSAPNAVFSLLEYALKYHIPLVLATTGYDHKAKEQITKSSKHIPIFMSPNLSCGINAIKKTALQLREKLKDNYDIEIIETHHRNKQDSPSGTALMLADALANTFPPLNVTYQRKNDGSKRAKSDLCISSVRGGGVFGDHTIMFMSDSEVIEITHRALGRQIFAEGALEAARFIITKNPGIYDDF